MRQMSGSCEDSVARPCAFPRTIRTQTPPSVCSAQTSFLHPTPGEMMSAPYSRTILWTLRVGAAMTFVGHGAFGIITKADWLPFFALVGIGPAVAYKVMPLIGTLDIVIGLSVLFLPVRALLVYMVVWTAWTAAL